MSSKPCSSYAHLAVFEEPPSFLHMHKLLGLSLFLCSTQICVTYLALPFNTSSIFQSNLLHYIHAHWKYDSSNEICLWGESHVSHKHKDVVKWYSKPFFLSFTFWKCKLLFPLNLNLTSLTRRPKKSGRAAALQTNHLKHSVLSPPCEMHMFSQHSELQPCLLFCFCPSQSA